MTTTVPPELADRVEAEAFFDFVSAADDVTRAALGVATTRVDGAAVIVIRNDSTGFWTRALGLGYEQPITAATIDRIAGYFALQGRDRGTLVIDPNVLPADWPEICARHGITRQGTQVKCVADAETVLAARTSLDPALRVGPASKRHAREWSTVMCSVFGFPDPGMIELGMAAFGDPAWRPFAVWEGDRIVATADLYAREGCAHMFGGATLPQARGRGAQTALLMARATAARNAGFRSLVAETGKPEGGTNPSLNNLLRLGFQPLYERPTWIWHATA